MSACLHVPSFRKGSREDIIGPVGCSVSNAETRPTNQPRSSKKNSHGHTKQRQATCQLCSSLPPLGHNTTTFDIISKNPPTLSKSSRHLSLFPDWHPCFRTGQGPSPGLRPAEGTDDGLASRTTPGPLDVTWAQTPPCGN